MYKNTESRDLHLGNEKVYNMIEDRLHSKYNLLEKKESTQWNNKDGRKMNPK